MSKASRLRQHERDKSVVRFGTASPQAFDGPYWDRKSGLLKGVPSNIHIMRWIPLPSCACQLLELQNKESGTWGVFQVERFCPAHSKVAWFDLRDVIVGSPDAEQQRIATVRRALLHDALPLSVTREQPDTVTLVLNPALNLYSVSGGAKLVRQKHPPRTDLKEGVDLAFGFEGTGYNRILHVGVDGPFDLTLGQKTYLQNHCDTVHEPGSIIVHTVDEIIRRDVTMDLTLEQRRLIDCNQSTASNQDFFSGGYHENACASLRH